MTYLAVADEPEAFSVRIPFPIPASLTLRAAGDMRRDGDSRSRYYDSIGLDPDAVCIVKQTHSRNVVVVEDRTDSPEISCVGEHVWPDADGLLTSREGLVFGVTVADCMPIFVYHPDSGARALLHSGSAGTGILDAAIGLMVDRFAAKPGELIVTMGPCISASSYNVDEERAGRFAAEWGPGSVRHENGAHYLDLRGANEEICRRRGVDVINTIDHCTVQEPAFGSHRREGPQCYTLMLALLGAAGTSGAGAT